MYGRLPLALLLTLSLAGVGACIEGKGAVRVASLKLTGVKAVSDGQLKSVLATSAEAPELPLTGPAHVVEFAPPRNIAIGAETPWGVGAPLDDLLPGTTAVRLTEEDLIGLADPVAPVLAGADGRPLVLVARDVHRHPWLAAALRRVLESRPDAIVVEMGVPVTVVGGVHIATYGATRALGQAAAELIAGTPIPAPTPQPLAA